MQCAVDKVVQGKKNMVNQVVSGLGVLSNEIYTAIASGPAAG
jgi:hypothetical protein